MRTFLNSFHPAKFVKRVVIVLMTSSLLLVLVAGWSVYAVPLPARLSAADSVVLRFDDGQPAHVFLSEDERWRITIRPEQVDPRYLQALLRYEDKRFYTHSGVDVLAMLRAAWLNLKHGQIVSGGSTLTMQVVRLLEPRPRTIRSKFIEMLRAIQLEFYLSKDEILTAYLRFAPLGKNIEGIGAATLTYFGHDVQALSPTEIAILIAVPQNPNRRFPCAQNMDALRRGVDEVASRLHGQGLFSDAELGLVYADGLVHVLRPMPREASHAANWLKSRHPDRPELRSTLSASVQRTAERVLSAHQSALSELGIHNAAIVVIDVRHNTARALVGGFDYWDSAYSGQVAGFTAARSPGSALKPFLYAMALDRGLVLPEFMVQDVPVRFGSYAPENYDQRFRGLVRLHTALSSSLNIPFVNILKELRVDTLLSWLRQHGVHSLAEDERYGLSAAIGALEVTPLALTNLYAAMARDGAYKPVAALVEDNITATAALSPGAAYLTRQALRERDRPDFPSRHAHVVQAPHAFWKTGTSYGHRDAWALGCNGTFVVGVWLGNLDNTPARALVGSSAAGPVMFDVLDALTDRKQLHTGAEPPSTDLIEVEVCALSGRVPSDACPHRSVVLALRHNVPSQTCTWHQHVDIDDASGHALCPLCRHDRRYHQVVATVLPPEVRHYTTDARLRGTDVPSHLPSCPQVLTRRPPHIVEPQVNTEIFLVPGLAADAQEIALEAQLDGREREVFWFVDGKLLAKAAINQRVWLTPRPGTMEIRAVDSTGSSDVVRVKVRQM